MSPPHLAVSPPQVGGALATSGRATLSVEQLLAVGISDELRLSIGRAALPINHPSTRCGVNGRVFIRPPASPSSSLLVDAIDEDLVRA